jgi:hypothetical protein
MGTTCLPAMQLHQGAGDLLARVHYAGERFIVERHGEAVAWHCALVSPRRKTLTIWPWWKPYSASSVPPMPGCTGGAATRCPGGGGWGSMNPCLSQAATRRHEG